MTFEPLRQPDFWPISDISLTPSLAPHRARTSAAPTPAAKVSTGHGRGSSSKRSASSANAASLLVNSELGVLVGSLLRTALISELKALTGSLMRWRASATPAGHSWSVLTIVAQTTSASGPGLSDATSSRLPTPMAQTQQGGMRWEGGAGGRKVLTESGLMDVMKGKLPTPMASDRSDSAGGGSGSTHAFRMIRPTPRKTDADRGFRGDIRAQLDGQNNRHAGMLPTPRAADMTHGPEMTKVRGEKNTGMGLRTFLHPAAQTLTMDASNPDTSASTESDGLIPATPATMQHGQNETLPTPTKSDGERIGKPAGPGSWAKPTGRRLTEHMERAMAPTPLKSDRKGSLGVHGSNGKVKSPNMPTYIRDGKWAYARQIAAVLTDHGLSGASMTLPAVYGWMMGYPPGWLEHALLSAVRAGLLPLPSLSKRTATPSSRKSRKQSAGQS